LLDLAAIGIPNAIAEQNIGTRRRLHQQQLITADTEVTIREKTHLLCGRHKRLAHTVNDDKVIAEAMHFAEAQLHSLSEHGLACE
jgi:hypothetical protein